MKKTSEFQNTILDNARTTQSMRQFWRRGCFMSIFNRKPTVYIIIDLVACYDRQLSSICSMVEESVCINREGIKLILKVLLVLRHFICTEFSISKKNYGDIKQEIGRTA